MLSERLMVVPQNINLVSHQAAVGLAGYCVLR